MADILLKYLTELSSATSVADDDLFHINQGGNDRSIAFSVLKRFIVDAMYPANSGIVVFFAKAFNPNNQYPGTVWARIPGVGKTIRLASEDMADVLSQGGADSVRLSTENLPAHNHVVNLQTSSFDYGNKPSSSNGQHRHNFQMRVNNYANSTGGNDVVKTGGGTTFSTEDAGAHTHNTYIGPHQHSVYGYTDNSSTPNNPLNISNQYVKLIGWYRTA
ncbi:hypothetical protein [Klebsiella pneumoniae]|uniref:hypothetical protein n=1 Tax=Klebsiella pneumoniae TaxID=573 RepID=UPI00092E3045|nr:hypothetical protein [Klebsiella pneumoniae]